MSKSAKRPSAGAIRTRQRQRNGLASVRLDIDEHLVAEALFRSARLSRNMSSAEASRGQAPLRIVAGVSRRAEVSLQRRAKDVGTSASFLHQDPRQEVCAEAVRCDPCTSVGCSLPPRPF